MERITHEQFLEALKLIQAYEVQLQIEMSEVDSQVLDVIPFKYVMPDTNIFDAGMSRRLFNIIAFYWRHERK